MPLVNPSLYGVAVCWSTQHIVCPRAVRVARPRQESRSADGPKKSPGVVVV